MVRKTIGGGIRWVEDERSPPRRSINQASPQCFAFRFMLCLLLSKVDFSSLLRVISVSRDSHADLERYEMKVASVNSTPSSLLSSPPSLIFSVILGIYYCMLVTA